MRERRGRDEFLKPYRVAAVVLLVLGLLCVLIELQSPSFVYWDGQRVPATNDAGIVYYTVAGEQRTLDDPHEAPARPVPTVVYADPDDSSRDRQAGPARWLDAIFVVGPFLGAAAVLGAGLARRRRIRGRVAADRAALPVRSGSEDGPPPSRSTPSRRSSR